MDTRFVARIVWSIGIFLLCACQPLVKSTTPIPQDPGVDSQHDSDNILQLMQQFLAFNTFSEKQLIAEKRELESRCQQDGKPADCLLLAYLLSLSAANVENLNRAQALLNQVEKDSRAHVDHQILAKFLALHVEKADAQIQQRRKERRRRAELQKRLDALTDIETKINEREPIPNSSLDGARP